MPDLTGHCRIVLSAVLPARKDLLDYATQHLNAEHFVDPHLKIIFGIMDHYASQYNAVLPKAVLEDSLRKKLDVGKLAVFSEMYQLLHDSNYADSDFFWSVDQVKELNADKSTGEIITKGMEIFRVGVQDKFGDTLKGHQAARNYIVEQFSDIERHVALQSAPEGNMRGAHAEMLDEYEAVRKARLAGKTLGVQFSIPELDKILGGFHPGELNLIAAASGVAKTQLCVSLSHAAVVHQKKNVVYFTTETLYAQVRRRINARHSREEKFNLRDGINSRDIKWGSIPTPHEPVYSEIVRDISTNPEYGNLYIAQMPNGATMELCEQKLYRIQRKFNIDLVVIDYLRLFSGKGYRRTDQETLNSVLIDAKQIATTFNNGNGVPIVSPWQITREKQEEAIRTGYYTQRALAETAQSYNLCDVCITMYDPDEVENSRYKNLKAQVLKNRDGETASNIDISVDCATSYFLSGSIQHGKSNGLANLDDSNDLNLLLGA